MSELNQSLESELNQSLEVDKVEKLTPSQKKDAEKQMALHKAKVVDKVEKLTPSQKKDAEKQMALHKAKVIDGKKAKFETRASYQNQYSGVESIIPQEHMFGMDQARKMEIAARIKRDQIEESKPVKGIFRNFETPGGQIKFPYRAYKGDPIVMIKLKDGQVATVPLGVARHLRHRLEYPVRGWRVDENNLATHTATARMVKRCTFEYIDTFDSRDEEFREKQARSMTGDVIPTHLGSIGGR